MKKALKTLLDDLDTLALEHDEVGDTDVREQMRDAVEHALIEPVAGFTLPDTFGMFSPEGNAKVKAALAKFIPAATVEAQKAGLTSRNARLAAFQDLAVESGDSSTYDEYFGHEDSVEPA